MKKLTNSNFEMIQDIIKDLELENLKGDSEVKNDLSALWSETVGDKISKFSRFADISSDNIIIISCADSYVSNELYYNKEKILELMKEKAEKLGIKIHDIVFNYKIWKENK